MLSNLYIENIAVIEKTNIEFCSGFNVLTGETGAGKSIIIDAINAVLGQRTGRQIIRNGASSAFVSATFTDVGSYALLKAQQLGFNSEDGTLILQRELTVSGRNICHINSRPASVTALKELGAYLINIHGQNDNAELMTPSLHMHYIDSLANIPDKLKAYKNVYLKLKETEHELNDVKSNEADRLSQIDLLTYQIDELENAGITIGELDSLQEEKTVLLNIEKIAKALLKSKLILDGDGEESGVTDNLDEAILSVMNASRYDTSLEPLADRMSNVLYELQDCSADLNSQLDDLENDPARLEEIEERLDLLYKLSRKYGATESDMLDFLEKAKEKLNYLLDYTYNREQLELKYSELLEKANTMAQEISDIRRAASDDFSKKVQAEMAFLEMPNVKLIVSREKAELNSRGFDKMEFLISTNPGEAPKPVAKIASGGELSRMMLAIKTVLSDSDFIQTLIFDEIDTGISGSAAEKVGKKLKQVSADRQVMCVTHQAQIASFADNHLLILKEFKDDKTYTHVDALDYDGRARELARIIGGASITKTALDHARQLLNNS